MSGRKPPDEFALYKGDLLVAIGTAEEIARRQGVTAETIRYYSTPAHRRRASGTNRFVAVRIDRDWER